MRLDHIDPIIPRMYYIPYQDFKAAWCIWRYWLRLKRLENFDIVQVTNVMSVGLFFRYERTLPVVTRLSSFRPLWDTASGIPITPGVRVRWWMERIAIKGTSHVFAPSNYVAHLAEREYGLQKVSVIGSPFSIDGEVSPCERALEPFFCEPFALFFGRQTQMKGVDVLGRSVKRIFENYPDFRIAFVGNDGISPNGGSMMEYIKDLLSEYSDRLYVSPAKKRDELFEIVANARLVILPSICDNLPNTCLESMALGRVVIATQGTCFEELIEDTQSGFLVEAGSEKKLEEKIHSVWRFSDDTLKLIGGRAKSAMRRFAPESAVTGHLEFYQRAVAASKMRNRAR